ncbi:MAG: hypothetical protein QM749_04495 [Aquabacterium sp.]
MRTSTSLDEFDEHWTQFLHRVERVWSKTIAHYGRSPKWGNWAAGYIKDRRRDQLLSYLINARGAEEHTTAEVTAREQGGLGVRVAPGAGLQPDGRTLIQDMTFGPGPDGMYVSSTLPLQVALFPARVRLLPVENRGRTYPIPTIHLDVAIDPDDLIATAELALHYYVQVVEKAEWHFVK